MQTPEGKVKAAVKRWFLTRGIFYYMPVSNGMGRVGAADFICCDTGFFVAVETKAPGKINNLTPNQLRFHEEVRAAGGWVLVVDDVAQLDTMWPVLHRWKQWMMKLKSGADPTGTPK